MNRQSIVNLLLRLPASIVWRLRCTFYRLAGARLGHHCVLRRISIPRNPWDVKIGDRTCIDDFTVLLSTGEACRNKRIEIGNSCYVNRFSMIDASEHILIGDHVMIGPNCYITDHDHGTALDQPATMQPLISKPVVIERDVWIGAGVVILKGVRIGEQAIIAAGAVVTKNVPPRMIVAGVPARVIGERGKG